MTDPIDPRCPVCWNPFTPTVHNPAQRFCRSACRVEQWRRDRDAKHTTPGPAPAPGKASDPCRDDRATTTPPERCPVCQTTFQRIGRQRFCSDTCRKTAWRRRHSTIHPTPVVVPVGRRQRDVTIYACGLGFAGSERTTRRAVARAKVAFKAGRVRVHRPWVTEPGMWLQYDFGDGPVIDGRKTVLFCVWLAWSRFRVVLALRDRTAPSVFAALDVTLRRIGGAPTYVLTDNEKTVTVEHVAGMAVRNPQTVAFARYYGLSVLTCEPADPASKGGSESTVKLAKADLVPTDTNLLAAYGSFAEFERACEVFCEVVNARVHRVTRRAPVDMLAEERLRLHPLPAAPHTVAFGVTRTVGSTSPMVTYEHALYSVPHTLLGQTVWVRVHGQGPDERVVIVHVSAAGPVEVARHLPARPGSPRLDDAHFPPAPAGALARQPKAKNTEESEFLALGDGARLWLTEAAANGSTKMRVKMAAAVALAKLGDPPAVDWALGHAAMHGRFAEADLGSIVAHHAAARQATGPVCSAGEDRSLTQGTASWAALGSSTGDGA